MSMMSIDLKKSHGKTKVGKSFTLMMFIDSVDGIEIPGLHFQDQNREQ